MWTDGRTEITKITVGYHNFASMPKNGHLILLLLCSCILLRVIPNSTTRDEHKKESLNLKDPLHPSDFNFVPSYSMFENSYNIMFGIIGLLIISIFGGGALLWLICPSPSVICLPYYLKFLTLFVVFVGG
jgi:hypothetical protein